MLQTLIEFFQQGVHQSEILSRTQRLLAVHSMDTLDLITQVIRLFALAEWYKVLHWCILNL